MRRAVVVDGEAAILPAEAALFLPRLQPMLARLGIALVDVPRPTVDLTTGELVITSPAIDHDADVVTRLATGVRLGRGERPVVDAGRYPLRAWCMVRHGPGLVTRLSTAEAAVGVVSSISGTDDLASRLGELGAMFADGSPTGFGIWHSAWIHRLGEVVVGAYPRKVPFQLRRWRFSTPPAVANERAPSE